MTSVWPGVLAPALDPAQERPALRPDAELVERVTRWGERDAVVHAPGTGYLRLHGAEADIVRRCDGAHTVAELAAADLDDPDGVAFDDVALLVEDLYGANLLARAPVDAYAAIGDRLLSPAAKWRRRIARFAREQTIAIRNVDGFAGWVYTHGGRLLFAPAVVAASAAVIVGGVAALFAVGHTGSLLLTTDVSGGSALWLFVLLLGALVLHELGHAVAVKHAGRRVVRAGFQLYLGHPAFFIDSTDLVFATPMQRAVNAVAGPFVEATLAGLAALTVWIAPGVAAAPTIHRFAVVAYVNVALNLIPFIELDGYWLLTDLLDTPRLRARSFAVLRHDVPARLRRRRGAFSRAERALALFGVLGLLFTTAAITIAFTIWLPVARRLVQSGWRAGLAGRAAVVLVLALAAGPLAQFAITIVRSLLAALARGVDNLRFRIQTKWRVEAADAIAALPSAVTIDDDALSDLAGRVIRRRVRAGASIVRQGEAANEFFVVRRGRFEVVERDAAGGERFIRRVGPGDAFGELALLDARPRTASVRAASDGELFVLEAGAFKRLVAPALSESVLAPALGPALEVQSLPAFRGLSLGDAARVASGGEWLDAAAGDVLVVQGEPSDGFYVLVSGQASVERDGALVASLRAGDHFGELALLDDAPRQATVRATTPSRLLRIDGALFHDLVAAAINRGGPKSERRVGGEFA